MEKKGEDKVRNLNYGLGKMIAKTGEPDSDDPRSRSRSKSPKLKKSSINEI